MKMKEMESKKQGTRLRRQDRELEELEEASLLRAGWEDGRHQRAGRQRDARRVGCLVCQLIFDDWLLYKQEPGDAAQIGSFCEKNFGVTFPMFEKVDVKGPDAHPLFRYLTDEARGLLGTRSIKWNFTKFLVDRNGKVLERYAPKTKPEEIVGDIERLL